MIQPRKWSVPLGSGADVQDLPDDDLRYASFSKIFPQITQVPLSAGGVAPRRIDFNSLFKLLADNIYFYQNGGVFEYSDTADYEKGAIVRYNDKIYLCIQDNSALNTHNPEDMDYWLRVALSNELSDYLPLAGGNITGNLSVQNKNVVRTVNDVEADVNGNIVIESGTSYEIGQIIKSLIPLTNAMLHPTDGAVISGSGSYAEFVTLMAGKVSTNPDLFVSEAVWQQSITNYGECGKFVYDDVANTIRLPLLNDFVQATNNASEVGNLVEAGLPSIEHTHSLAQPLARYTPHKTLSNGAYTPSDLSSGINYTGGIRENLNPIYGNSNTVQPQAIKVYSYIVLGTVTKTDIQIDIDNVMADLALKADTDFSNINTSAKITIAHNSMPSGVYEDLTVGASGSTYTAPADGYFSAFNRNASQGAVILTNLNSKMQITSHWISGITDGAGFVPVKKGDRVTLAYTGGTFGSIEGWFVFIYAVGSESEQ